MLGGENLDKEIIKEVRKEAFLLKTRNRILNYLEEFFGFALIIYAMGIVISTGMTGRPEWNEPAIISLSIFAGIFLATICFKVPLIMILWRFFSPDYNAIRSVVEQRKDSAKKQQDEFLALIQKRPELLSEAYREVEERLQGAQEEADSLSVKISEYSEYLKSITDK